MHIQIHRSANGTFAELCCRDSEDEDTWACSGFLGATERLALATRLREVAAELSYPVVLDDPSSSAPLQADHGKTREELDAGYRRFEAGMAADEAAIKGSAQ